MNYSTMKTSAIWDYIRENYDAIRARAGTLDPRKMERINGSRTIGLPKAPVILGTSKKVEATSRIYPGVLSKVLYLSPAHESFIDKARTVCPFATTCVLPCLGHNSGRQALSDSFNSRLWKTTVYMGARAAFRAVISREIETMVKRCAAQNLTFAFRFDGASDLGEGKRLARAFPDALFFDYTKSEARALSNARGAHPDNFRQCYSYDGTGAGEERARRVLDAGGTVAVVFDSLPAIGNPESGYIRAPGPLPRRFLGYPTFDGDRHDLLNMDPRGAVRALRFKAQRDRAGMLRAAGPFVVALDDRRCK